MIDIYFLQYYTDPVSGHIFRSLKDVERYLKTGELGRHAYKPKDKVPISVELGDDKLSVSFLIIFFFFTYAVFHHFKLYILFELVL